MIFAWGKSSENSAHQTTTDGRSCQKIILVNNLSRNFESTYQLRTQHLQLPSEPATNKHIDQPGLQNSETPQHSQYSCTGHTCPSFALDHSSLGDLSNWSLHQKAAGDLSHAELHRKVCTAWQPRALVRAQEQGRHARHRRTGTDPACH